MGTQTRGNRERAPERRQAQGPERLTVLSNTFLLVNVIIVSRINKILFVLLMCRFGHEQETLKKEQGWDIHALDAQEQDP